MIWLMLILGALALVLVVGAFTIQPATSSVKVATAPSVTRPYTHPR